jgi:cytochrome P450
MRLFPVASSGTMRITDRPTVVDGHHLPAGQPILFPLYSIHRSPRLWPQPHAFRPERFLKAPVGDASTAGGGGGAATAPGVKAADGSGGSGGDADAGAASADGEYVDVAADLAAWRDQDAAQQQQEERHASNGVSKAPPAGAGAGSLDLADATVDRRGFLPFSLGSRNCVGQSLALVELKAVLAMLLGNFEFQLDESMGGYAGVEASARQTITLRPSSGLLMRLRHRSQRC